MAQNKDQGSNQVFDLLNFKGIFFENEHQKYTCPVTGAHFEVNDLCRRLNAIKIQREKDDDKCGPQKGNNVDLRQSSQKDSNAGVIQKTSILEVEDIMASDDQKQADSSQFKSSPQKYDRKQEKLIINNQERLNTQPTDINHQNAYVDMESINKQRQSQGSSHQKSQSMAKNQLTSKAATQAITNNQEGAQQYYTTKQQFNRTVVGGGAALALDLQISKSANQFDMENRNQAIQKLDQIASKIGVKDTGRNNNASNKMTKNNFYNTQQYPQIVSGTQQRNSSIKPSGSIIQNDSSFNSNNPNQFVFNKTLYQPNMSSNSGNNIGNQYGLAPIEQSTNPYYHQKKNSKFSIKHGESIPYKAYESKKSVDQDYLMDSNGQKMIKDAYLTTAIEKYKQKRKEDMNNGRNRVGTGVASNNINNFKSFDNSSKVPQRNSLIEHNRVNSVYNQVGLGQTQSNFTQNERTRNGKISGGSLIRGTGNLHKAKMSGSLGGNADFINISQGNVVGNVPTNNNLGIFGSKKDIADQQMRSTLSSFQNNHRKLNSYQLPQYSGLQNGYTPEKMKQLIQQKKIHSNANNHFNIAFNILETE